MKRKLIVLQEGNKDCGPAALLSIVRYYGGDISLNRLIEMTKTTNTGTNFYNLKEAALNLGLATRSYQVEDIEKLKNIKAPYIVQLNNKNYTHFVVVYKIINDNVLIMDPASGKKNIDLFEFSSMWTGYIMLFEKIKNLPFYEEKKILNKIIISTIFKNRSLIISLIILSIIFTILACVTSLYSKVIFDKIIDTNINNLIIVTITFSILYLIKNFTSFIRNHLIICLNQKLDVNIILSTFSKIILLPYAYYKNKTTSEVLTRINDLSSIKKIISKIIVSIFLDSIIFIVSLIILYNINKKVTYILLLISLFYLLIILVFNPIIRKITRINQENLSSVNNNIIESVSSFETVKGLNIEDNVILKFSKLYSKSLNSVYFSEKTNNIMLFLKEIINDLGLLFISFLGIKLVMENSLTLGSYMTITFLMGYLIYPIKNIMDILNEYHYTKNSIKRANSLLEIEEEKIYEDNKLKVSGNILIKNLYYTFNNKKNILDNLSLEINSGEKVLILGSSGGGKSTLLKILYKYYSIERDKIYINNYDINDYSLSDIRKNIVYVSQNEILYTDSIRNNILLDRNIKEEDYLNICRISFVEDIIKDSILGYDYLLEENGVNISGGQRQRIILARSLLKKSSIIMIDEGLNQIDIDLERKILKNIFYYFYDKTFIIVSHRTDNMDLYDRVVKINSGKVIQNLVRGG